MRQAGADVSDATLVSWPFVIAQLNRHGVTMKRIADETGLSQSKVQRLSSNELEDPPFHKGVRLLDLALDKLPRPEFDRLKEEINQ